MRPNLQQRPVTSHRPFGSNSPQTHARTTPRRSARIADRNNNKRSLAQRFNDISSSARYATKAIEHVRQSARLAAKRGDDHREETPIAHAYFATTRRLSFEQAYVATVESFAGDVMLSTDPCLYRRVKNGKETLIAVVVDDLLIAGDTDEETKRVIRCLCNAGLETKDNGHPEYIIGMHVHKHRNGDISINQRLYIETLIRRFNMSKMPTPRQHQPTQR